jgi:transcriptional regulator EpsA
MRIIVRLTNVRDSNAFLAVVNSDVADVLRHEAMACGLDITWSDGNYVSKMLRHNYSLQYFDVFTAPEGKDDSPLLQRWRATLEPVVFQSERDDDEYPDEWVKIFKRYGLRNTAAHGVLDVQGAFASYFIFSNIAGAVGEKEIFLLKLLMPHLHSTLTRALTSDQGYDRSAEPLQEPITEMEKEILQWINQGKTNWEISHILSKTENNVKYSVAKILAKLEVRNRTQAVSKAIQLGFLSMSRPNVDYWPSRSDPNWTTGTVDNFRPNIDTRSNALDF